MKEEKKEETEKKQSSTNEGKVNEAKQNVEEANQETAQSQPEEEKELIVLRYVNDEPISEICRLTGISRFTVYRRIKEAKAKLEVLLERGEDERQ